MVGRELRRLWKGVCDVVVQEQHRDPDTGRTVSRERVLARALPCRLSFKTAAGTGGIGHVAEALGGNAQKPLQSVKLFLGREVEVPPGSRLAVTQNGFTAVYRQSGPAAVYSEHQELRLELADRWT